MPTRDRDSNREAVLVRWFRQRGVDGRFLLFVIATMVGSVICGGLAAGAVAFAVTGEAMSLVFVPFVAMIGAGFIVPVAFLIWFLPSALIFALVRRGLEGWVSAARAIQVAAVLVTAIASGLVTLALSEGGRDIDGAGGLMLFITPAALVLAPLIARRVFREADAAD